MDLTDEVWHDIPGYEGYYQVSSRGRVRSLNRAVPHAQYGNLKLRGRIKPAKCKRDVCRCARECHHMLSKNGELELVTLTTILHRTFGES